MEKRYAGPHRRCASAVEAGAVRRRLGSVGVVAKADGVDCEDDPSKGTAAKMSNVLDF
jgi:hypothetical protein